MKLKTFLTATAAVAFLALGSTSALARSVDAGNGWTCTANNIQNARYDGGARAYIHLNPYKDGNRYRVTLSTDGKTATGTTSNGTAFTCTRN